MKVALDVQYNHDYAIGAALAFSAWSDPEPCSETTLLVRGVEPYEPGSFFKRELPVLLATIAELPFTPNLLIIDGHVWLGPDKPGLGWHLHQQVEMRMPVVGVAKTSFAGAAHAHKVFRGVSRKPLYVTSVGMEGDKAARAIASMAGEHRLPTLLKQVDTLARKRFAETTAETS